MPEDTSNDAGPSVPPKLDLRKTGVLTGHVWPAPGGESDAGSTEAPPAIEKQPVSQPEPVAPPAAPRPAAAVEPAAPRPEAPPIVASPAKPKPAAESATPVAAAAAAVAPVAETPAPAAKRVAAKVVESKEAPAPAPAAKAKPLGSKRETSRIPLDLAAKASATAGPPKTIKIKPVAAAPVAKAAPPAQGAAKPATEAQVPGAGRDAAKRKTSRIPLEAALVADAAAKKPGAPSTIRLKRPSETAAATSTERPAAEADAKPDGDAAGKVDLGKTSRLDAAASIVPETGAPTRRKTIRVKRPSQGQTVKGLSVARSAEQPAIQVGAAPAVGLEPATEEVAKAGWFSNLCAIAAVLVACVVIYMLLAQAFGPDSSLTRLSYGMPELNLAWPGKRSVN